MKRSFVRYVFLLAPLVLFSACASTKHPGDPLHGWNKGVSNFNYSMDKAFIEPTARGYRAIIPKPARDGIHNFLDNFRSPLIFASDVLQGHPSLAGDTLGRFVVNTTFGVGGLFDVAKRGGLARHDEDMGQVLGVWGFKPGPYLVLPFLGPSNFRDSAGLLLDTAFNPLTYMRFNGRFKTEVGIVAMRGLAVREANLETINSLRDNSLDFYASQKTAYEQYRANAIANGKVDLDALPDFDEYDDPEDQQ